MAIVYDDNSIHVYRGQTRKKTVYTSPAGVIRLSAFYDKFLPVAATVVSTWSTVPSGDSRVSFASSAVSGQGVETYCTAVDNLDPFTVTINNKAVASTGETVSVSWRLHVTDEV